VSAVGADERVAIAKLASQVHLGRDAGEPLHHRAAQHRRVERRAAGDQDHPLDGAHGVGGEVHVRQDHVAGLGRDPAAEGVGDGARLLVHLLEHEVPVATLLGHDRIPQDADRGAPDRLAVEGRQLDRVGGDDRDLVVLEHDHVARVGEDRGNVGRHEHLALAEPDDDAAGALLGGDQPVGRGRRDDADRVRAGHLLQGRLHGPVEPAGGPEVMLDEVGDHLGVGLRLEPVSFGEESVLDLQVVLDDPVVDHHQRAVAVGVGVGVLLRGTAVSGPAREERPG